jgi:hypothetical protein
VTLNEEGRTEAEARTKPTHAFGNPGRGKPEMRQPIARERARDFLERLKDPGIRRQIAAALAPALTEIRERGSGRSER